jgi:predicted permease
VPVLHRFVSLWRNMVYRDRVDRDLDEEIRTAFESLVDERVRAGARPEDARRAATLEFGVVEGVKDRVRDARTGARFDAWRQDVRYAARLLRRNPVFTLVATLSLAIGIGANTTIVTVANALLLRAPAGVSEPDRLVDIFRAEEGKTLGNFTTSYPYYLDVRERTTTLESVFAYELEPRAVSVGAADGTELAFANLVTANYFATLGVGTAAGRLFAPNGDLAPGATPFVVLSYRFWQRRFNQDAAIVGETVQINRHPFMVIGIAHEGFRGTNVVSPDLWVPMGMVDVVQPGTHRLTSRTVLDVGMSGRLKPSVSRPQAAAELDTLAFGIESEHPIEDRGMRLRVARLTSIPGALTTVAARLLGLLLMLVSTVLVIACANVSSVLLARATARRREIAVRIAIGAGRARLMRQLLTETMLLFTLGGAAGLLLARGLTSLLLLLLPAFPVPVDVSLPLDGRVVLFTIAVSLVAALLAGVAPALHASKADVVVALKDESQGPSDRLRVRSVFVIAQVAFSLMLVVIAGLLVQSLERIGSFNQGFDPKGVEVASVDLTAAGYTTTPGAIFTRELIDRLRALPGIEAATLSHWMPGRGGTDVSVTSPGVSPPAGESSFTGTWNAVESDFFRTLHVPLIAGREFSSADRADRQPVTIVSETTARYLWPGQDAVGKYITWHEVRPERSETVTTLRVVGVVPDLKSPFDAAQRGGSGGRSQARRDGQPFVINQMLMMYVPLQQRYAASLIVLVRTIGGRRMASEVRNLVKAMDANLPMGTPQPLDTQTGPVYLQIRVAASVAGTVGVVGLLLAAIGVYGVTAYTTFCRTREIGVRMALGARRGNVIGMVLRQGMSLVGIGAFAGLILAAAGSRLFAGLLAGVPPLDPITFGGATVLFALVGLAACYVPARRATQINAMEALRYE